ncbi:MAG TPA: hypothetical protein VK662_14475 [Acidothermaceae bacterium]|nr:hypothetical protein [Acidothermaceae bacterium]
MQHAGRARPLGTALGIVLAAAPWALVLFAPVSEGASPPALAAQASASASPPNYAPLLVVPLDSSVPGNSGNSLGTTGGPPVVSSAGPAPAPPLWLINAQLREPASAVGAAPLVSAAVLDSLKATGIPRVALSAYITAATMQDRLSPTCGLSWQVLAGIGYIESDHARSGGSAKPNWSGVANPPIYGPLLDGQNGIALITDTDGGALDGNATYDRAVGPMQFLPATWREYEEAASGHAAPDPQNINDATLAAARYLCATGQDLRTADGLIAAVYGYNHSFAYVSAVLSVAVRYAGGNLPGGTSALEQLPALAQTAAGLPMAIAIASGAPSAMPHPSPSPEAGALPSASPSVTPAYPYVPAPPALPAPPAAPSQPASPLPSSPPASPTVVSSPTSSPSPTPDPSPSSDPSPTASAPASPAPSSGVPTSASPSPSAESPTSPSPSVTSESP